MKIIIERQSRSKHATGEPISLTGLTVEKNRHGQWTVHFSSENHKYLSVNYDCTSTHVGGELCEHGWAHGFTIEAPDTFLDPEINLELPEDHLTLYLVPENEEEHKALCGGDAVLAGKWSYSICIVPYEDFY